ncbi:MAG: response regulator [Desulfosalsimonadaceae bacterium]
MNSIDLNQIKTFQETVIQPGKYIVINVGDTGGGIDPLILDRIFDPYFSTKKNEEGTGLGLAVSKEIIKNHHGAITVQNKPGEGCVFQIFLPQVNAEMTKQSTKESKKAFLKGTERILLVDDEEILVSALSLLLSMFGYQLTTETDSRKALRRFETNPDAFDIVITDQTMPGMTGKELAGKILAIRPGIPIILCTGYSDQVNKEEAFAAGINDFIMKPCKVNDLCISIRKLIDKV